MNGCNGFWWIIEAVHFVDEPRDTTTYLLHKASDRFSAISAMATPRKILGKLEVVLHDEKSSLPRWKAPPFIARMILIK